MAPPPGDDRKIDETEDAGEANLRPAEVLGSLEPLPVDAYQATPEGRALHRRLSGHALMKDLGKAAS